MLAKKKGGRLEREAKCKLEAQGYDVFKIGGSFGLFDLVAIKRGAPHALAVDVVVGVQVKANRIRPGEKRGLAGAWPFGIQIWVKPDYSAWQVERWNHSTQQWEPEKFPRDNSSQSISGIRDGIS